MPRITIHRRGRSLASFIAVAGLCAGTAAVTTGPAGSAEPGGDCPVAHPVAELTNGQAVDGLTVTSGTAPEPFTGEVLGVLDDAIGAGLDMVMVRLTSAEIDRVGIWQGMSGSPVYAADGRLIGAVAYGLAMGSSPVAGVTPFEDMDDYLDRGASAPEEVDVPRAAARIVARATDVSRAAAAEGFAQLPMPLGVAGVSGRRLAGADDRAGDHTWLQTGSHSVGRAAQGVAGPEDIVAGGNIAASLSYGDVTMAGVGTVTSVCAGRVVGFGHPAQYLGATSMGLHPADAVYIQEDLISGFKLANLGEPIGSITDDRLTGITGSLGDLPDTATLTSIVTSGDRSRTGTTQVPVRLADVLAMTTFYANMANHDRVVDGPARGTEVVSWTVTGTDPVGEPFELGFADRYVSESDLTWQVGFDLGDLVYAVGRIPGVTIESITTGGDFVADTSTYRIDRLEQRRQGRWVEVDRRHPVTVRAGHRLVARATLAGPAGETAVPVEFAVPRRLSGQRAWLSVGGGGNMWSYPGFDSLRKAREYVDGLVRNDEVQATLGSHRHYYGGGESEVIVVMGRGAREFERTKIAGQADRVVRGQRAVPVLVR